MPDAVDTVQHYFDSLPAKAYKAKHKMLLEIKAELEALRKEVADIKERQVIIGNHIVEHINNTIKPIPTKYTGRYAGKIIRVNPAGKENPYTKGTSPYNYYQIILNGDRDGSLTYEDYRALGGSWHVLDRNIARGFLRLF